MWRAMCREKKKNQWWRNYMVKDSKKKSLLGLQGTESQQCVWNPGCLQGWTQTSDLKGSMVQISWSSWIVV